MKAMKAVILERIGENAAVLAENGTFIKVRQAGDVGEEIEIKEQSAPIRIWRSGAAKFLTAAAIVLALIGGSYHYMAVSVSAYVSIDAGESSVEMTVNRLGKVTSVRPVAETSAELAKALNVSVSGMSVEDAVNAALDTITDSGKTVSDEEPVIVGITSESEGQAQRLENAIAANAELPVRTVRVSENEREEAHKQDIGGGAYVLGTEDAAAEAPEEKAEIEDDIEQEATTVAETTVIPISDTELPVIEVQENENINKSDEIAPPQNEENEIVQAPDMSAPPQHNEQFTNEAPPEKPHGENQTAPAPDEGEKTDNMQQPDNMPPEQPGEQNGQPHESAIPEEETMPPKTGQQPKEQDGQEQGAPPSAEGEQSPDIVPPEQPGAQNVGAPEQGGGVPPEPPDPASGAVAPPAMPGIDAPEQR